MLFGIIVDFNTFQVVRADVLNNGGTESAVNINNDTEEYESSSIYNINSMPKEENQNTN